MTRQHHQRDVWRQITIPLVICGVILLTFAVLVVLGGTGEISQWADISIIWLIVPIMFFVILGILFVGVSIFLAARLTVELPFISFLIQQRFRAVQTIVNSVSDRLVEPFLRFEGFKAGARRASRGFRANRKPAAPSKT